VAYVCCRDLEGSQLTYYVVARRHDHFPGLGGGAKSLSGIHRNVGVRSGIEEHIALGVPNQVRKVGDF
jgi:hypothetical protein